MSPIASELEIICKGHGTTLSLTYIWCVGLMELLICVCKVPLSHRWWATKHACTKPQCHYRTLNMTVNNKAQLRTGRRAYFVFEYTARFYTKCFTFCGIYLNFTLRLSMDIQTNTTGGKQSRISLNSTVFKTRYDIRIWHDNGMCTTENRLLVHNGALYPALIAEPWWTLWWKKTVLNKTPQIWSYR